MVTYSGTALAGLTYSANGATAQYVPGTPDIAQLSTPDLNDPNASPAVFVEGPMGTLANFTANYALSAPTTPEGLVPYWNLYVAFNGDPNPWDFNTQDEIIIDGPTLTGSSVVHVLDAYDPYADPASLLYNLSIAYGPNDPYSDWGVSLSTLFGLTDGSGPMDFGNMTVMWAGIEIGEGGPDSSGLAGISSITVNYSTPDGASTLLLLGFSLAGLGVLSLRRNHLQAAK